MKKIFKNPLLTFIIGLIISGTIVYAGTMYARDITFDNSNSNLKDSNNQNIDNVQDAIDALFTKANSGTGKTICTYVDSTFGNSNDRYSVGTKYSCEVKDNTSYNFYVLTNHTESVDLIMEHNITELVGSTRTMNWQTAMDYFRNGDGASLNWEVPVSLPEAQAIADAVGNTTWNTTEKDENGWFYLDKNGNTYGQTRVANANNLSNYRWLYNYTRECSAYGCDSATSLGAGEAYGYWTSDIVYNSYNPTRAWSIIRRGYLVNDDVSLTSYSGVRPVISILKSNLS